MNRDDILKGITDIVKDILGKDDINLTEDSTAKDIEGWDSLAHISILEAVQSEYSVKFDLEEIIDMASVGDIITAVVNKR